MATNPSHFDPTPAMAETARRANGLPPSRFWLYALWIAMAVGLMAYAQTLAFTEDEGFHLLAALLIKRGMRPYLDFCFPQTPLNAYWNAFLLRFCGESWRVPHALASLETSAAMMVAAQFVLTRLPVRTWKVAAAVAACVMIGCNINLVEFGTLGQAYGLALFTSVCAFRLALVAVERRGWWRTFACAIFAGAAAASTLLAAAAAPVLLLWIVWCNRAGSRWIKTLAFAMGAAIPFAPVFYLGTQSPWVVWFNVVKYQLAYRTLYWPDPLTHDLDTATAWLADPQALLLGLLAICGVVYITRQPEWSKERRAEFYLSGWLAAGLTTELAFAHPTFGRYFCLATPFWAAPAAVGLYAIGSRVVRPDKPLWPVLVVSIIFAGALTRALCESLTDSYHWKDYETIAQKLQEVTPAGKVAFTEEEIYFLMRRRPPPGMEFGYSHKLKLSPGELSRLHITSEDAQKRQLGAGVFASAATCDHDMVAEYALDTRFQRKTDTHGCSVFWQPTGTAPEAATAR